MRIVGLKGCMVKAFGMWAGRFSAGAPQLFHTAEEALSRAERLAIKSAGVVVFEQDEELEVGPISVPRIIARFGESPGVLSV
jgi:hypothetical protein